MAHSRFGTLGRIVVVDLTTGTSTVEEVDESVNRQFLAGYGLGAWLMWKHFPPRADALAPEACFAIVAGLLTGARTPFSGRIQIVGKSPLTHTWADSNSGGSVASHLKRAGYDALVVKGRALRPSVLVIDDDRVEVRPAGALWGQQIPEAFDALTAEFGGPNNVGISAIGPAGEGLARIASVMNDRYHAFGRQGFGAVYGSKNLKAIAVRGTREVPVAEPARFKALCEGINRQYRSDIGWLMRLVVWASKPHPILRFVYGLFRRLGLKIEAPTAAMRQLWSDYGTTGAVAISIENGDAPLKNWKGVGFRDFPMKTHGMKLDGGEVKKLVTKKLSCGDCPAPCKGIVAVKNRGLKDVRRPDYETLIGFGANLANDDLELVTACHDACNRYGFDAVSSSATLAWACEAVERGLLSAADLDGIDLRWGNGAAALALTIKMGTGEGCGAWLRHGSRAAAEQLGKGSSEFTVQVRGSEPAYHDPRFTSLMGLTFLTDPTPGRHTAGSASWNETFGARFALPSAVPKAEQSVGWNDDRGKGVTQAHFSNSHQVLNGLGLCMFTSLTGGLPWLDLLNALTGWNFSEKELLACGERIQNLRHAFNLREGVTPADLAIPGRMFGRGDGYLGTGPLKNIEVPIEKLRDEYFTAMGWNPTSGRLARAKAEALGVDELLHGFLEG